MANENETSSPAGRSGEINKYLIISLVSTVLFKTG